ncbi:hypothetical protein REPUB_Repub18cG0041800 [Reevesia pubescens]
MFQADTRALKLSAWKQLTLEEGKEIPKEGDVQRLMLYGSADHVLHKVGYLLGLGDRHPSNLMLHRYKYKSNGKKVH